MSTKRILQSLQIALIIFSFSTACYSQNDVMMQAFYWDVPVDEVSRNGSWWEKLTAKSKELSAAGITALWVPSPSKGNFGIFDMGYGIYDHYDLGNYEQKGTVETRFGSRAELESMLKEMHNNNIAVYADIVLNHIYAGEDNRGVNPAVKQYVFDEAYRNGKQYVPYPTNDVIWKVKDAAPGDYHIKVKGYNLLGNDLPKAKQGYDINIDWTGTGLDDNAQYTWEHEPNNGNGKFNIFPDSGRIIRAHIESKEDIDEYKITLNTQHDILIKLTARTESASAGKFEWNYADQKNGYYPFEVWHNNKDITSAALDAMTLTHITYPHHTGPGEANYTWTYADFHPVDDKDWLGDGGIGDSIITNTRWFGNDINTFDPKIQTRLNDWGKWLADTVGFDGFRLDFVRGFQKKFVADWIKNLPLRNGSQRFIVGEYWTQSTQKLKEWVDTLAVSGADADVFDFALKDSLKRMCDDYSYEMHWLNHSGMVRSSDNSLPGTSVVTFVDNHDTGKEHDKWITQDFHMAYAYILTHEGRPTIFYPHYYSITQHDHGDRSKEVTAPSSLQKNPNTNNT
ncbi:MAG: alpha-amylase, partial [Candidatus Electrothrix sp. AR3]|nr:alpha-amylase [Candidatus Electrothrix sp. AR3]